jgi:hypothetical protein
MTWRELADAVPAIAGPGRERLEAARVALLATLRPDGSPRISPIEPYLTDEHLLLGAMSWSAKAADLRRDPRCALHSVVADRDSGEGELKLFGRVVVAVSDVRDACSAAWWQGRPPELATVFTLQIEEAAYIDWDIEGGTMVVRRWSGGRFTERRRRYP